MMNCEKKCNEAVVGSFEGIIPTFDLKMEAEISSETSQPRMFIVVKGCWLF
jgi:hypothetical protein